MGREATSSLLKSQECARFFSNYDIISERISTECLLDLDQQHISILLVQEVEGVEHLVYYLSVSLQRTEMNYQSIESNSLALIFETQKLRHYFLTHPLNLVTKSNPLRYLLSRPALVRPDCLMVSPT